MRRLQERLEREAHAAGEGIGRGIEAGGLIEQGRATGDLVVRERPAVDAVAERLHESHLLGGGSADKSAGAILATSAASPVTRPASVSAAFW